MDSSLVTVERTPEVWGGESAGYNACGGADGAGAVQERCRSGAGGAEAVQAACTICTATSIISGAGRCRHNERSGKKKESLMMDLGTRPVTLEKMVRDRINQCHAIIDDESHACAP